MTTDDSPDLASAANALADGVMAQFDAVPSLLDELDAANAKVRVAEDWVYEKTRELEELRSLIPVLVERVQRGGPSNLVDIADKYMTEAQAALLRALVAPSVPETEETTDAD